jgi:hypothetical protein
VGRNTLKLLLLKLHKAKSRIYEENLRENGPRQEEETAKED